jgi:hypothetical protein
VHRLRVGLKGAGAGVSRGQDAGPPCRQVHESAQAGLGDVLIDRGVVKVESVLFGKLVLRHLTSN